MTYMQRGFFWGDSSRKFGVWWERRGRIAPGEAVFLGVGGGPIWHVQKGGPTPGVLHVPDRPSGTSVMAKSCGGQMIAGHLRTSSHFSTRGRFVPALPGPFVAPWPSLAPRHPALFLAASFPKVLLGHWVVATPRVFTVRARPMAKPKLRFRCLNLIRCAAQDEARGCACAC